MQDRRFAWLAATATVLACIRGMAACDSDAAIDTQVGMPDASGEGGGFVGSGGQAGTSAGGETSVGGALSTGGTSSGGSSGFGGANPADGGPPDSLRDPQPCSRTAAPGANLQQEVDATPANGKLCLEPGTYPVTACIEISKKMTIAGIQPSDPQTSVLQLAPNTSLQCMLKLSSATDGVIVQDLWLDGNYAAASLDMDNAGGAIWIVRGSHAIVFNHIDSFRDANQGQCFGINLQPLHEDLTGGLISNNTITNIGTGGPWAYGIIGFGHVPGGGYKISHVKVLHNWMLNFGRIGVEFRGGVSDVAIRGNYIHGSGKAWAPDDTTTSARISISVDSGNANTVDGTGTNHATSCLVEDNDVDHWISLGGNYHSAARRNHVHTDANDAGSIAYCGIEDAGNGFGNLISGNTIGGRQLYAMTVTWGSSMAVLDNNDAGGDYGGGSQIGDGIILHGMTADPVPLPAPVSRVAIFNNRFVTLAKGAVWGVGVAVGPYVSNINLGKSDFKYGDYVLVQGSSQGNSSIDTWGIFHAPNGGSWSHDDMTYAFQQHAPPILCDASCFPESESSAYPPESAASFSVTRLSGSTWRLANESWPPDKQGAYFVDWGEGAPEAGWNTCPTLEHTYESEGPKRVRMFSWSNVNGKVTTAYSDITN